MPVQTSPHPDKTVRRAPPKSASSASVAPPPERLDPVLVAKAAGDRLRADIIKILAQDAFAVSELAAILAMAQPALSHHLKRLRTAGLLAQRREGTSVYYQRSSTFGQPLLQALFEALDAEPFDPKLARGVERVHRERLTRSSAFFANHADALKAQTELICAPEVYRDGVLTIAQTIDPARRERALEIGPGAGVLLRTLAGEFAHVVGVDNASAMLAETRRAMADLDHVELIEGDFMALGRAGRLEAFDFVLAAMVVHHLPSPSQFFQAAARTLSETGLLVVAELTAHDQEWVKQACGDLWMGFTPDELTIWAREAGLEPLQEQFLAQRNGFRLQVMTYRRGDAQ